MVEPPWARRGRIAGSARIFIEMLHIASALGDVDVGGPARSSYSAPLEIRRCEPIYSSWLSIFFAESCPGVICS